MKSISGMIVDTLQDQGIIQEEDVDKCRYGLDIFILSVLEVASILIIAAVIGNFFETLLFFAAFIPLRIYAGGYHADTKRRCYLISLGVYAVFTVVMRALPDEVYWIVAISATGFSMLLVLIAAPVIHKSKSVNDIERRYYRKLSIGICSVETTIVLLSTAVFPYNQLTIAMAFGQVAIALSMPAAILKGKTVENK